MKLPPVLELRPYQRRWIDDPARFAIIVKSARIGASFATGVKHILRRLERPNTTSTVLSASKAQSIEFVEQAQKNVQAIGAVAQLYQEAFADDLGATDLMVQIIRFANGSRIVALPANPRTARGYPGDAVLSEYAFSPDSYAIWAAIVRQIALGNTLDIESTPNGEQGKYFDLAKEFGLADGVEPSPNPIRKDGWSGHWVDVYKAVREGCPINIEEMRAAFRDEETFAQEFLCQFIKAQGAWIPLELVARAEDDAATLDWPAGYEPTGPVFGGIDVARDRDKTVAWFDEMIGDVAWTRTILRMHGMPFPEQIERVLPYVMRSTRTAVDSTGMGVGFFDYLSKACPGKVMGVNFAGTNDQGVKVKTAMAITFKQRMEKALDRIPRDQDIRNAFTAIKREPTSTGVRFDAPRIEVESAAGQKRKLYGHADEFWAKALCNLAAQSAPAAAFAIADEQNWYGAQSRGLMHETARGFASVESGRSDEETVIMARSDRRSVWG